MDLPANTLAYDLLMGMDAQEVRQDWSRRDTIVYNLGIGFGAAAIEDPAQRRFVLEDELASFPTMAAVQAIARGIYLDPRYGIDFSGILHGEEAVEIAKPLPVEGRLIGRSRVEGLWDRGAKGAVMTAVKTLHDASDDSLIATCRSTMMLRKNGGFGGTAEGAPQARPAPERAADGFHDIVVRPEQALVYRLSGDTNPLHAVPEVAEQAGFPKPILHGLCSFAIAARALVAAEAQGDPGRLRAFSVRFSSPTYPGETIRTAFWRLGGGEYALQARSVERDVVLLTGGRAVLV